MNVLNVVPMPPSSRPSSRPTAGHVPVMKAELCSALELEAGRRYVDVTVGAGGHTAALLSTPGTQVIGIDRDPVALRLAEGHLATYGDRVVLRHGRFSQLEAVLAGLGIERVDGIVADLGVSSMQLEDGGRGMSFRREGPLDMRMDRSEGETAQELIERLDVDELSELLWRLGEERRARRVARCIKQASEEGRLRTSLELRRAVVQAVGPARIGGVDPATRTFQALRIAVNDELRELEALLDAAARVLVPGGRIAVISFHSLEDRVAKRMFRRPGLWQPLSKKPLTAGDRELDDNPRARSAKLRAARRVELSAVSEEER